MCVTAFFLIGLWAPVGAKSQSNLIVIGCLLIFVFLRLQSGVCHLS